MAYIVSGTDLTAVANAIRTAGETSAPLEFPSGFVTAIGNISGGGGGGATNIVTGKFTGSTAEKGTAKSITLNYTGSGYPIAGIIYPSAGAWKSGTDIYSSTANKSLVTFAFAKANTSEAPDYSSSNIEKNQAGTFTMFKNNASDATSVSFTGQKNALTFYSGEAIGSPAAACVRFSSKTSMTVFIKNADYGFLAEQEYEYQIIYSS